MTSKKEKVWLNEYLKCWNATEAARRADYAWPRRTGSRKLKKFDGEIQKRIKDKAMGADEVLARLSEIARGEYSKYIEKDGGLDLESMVEDDKAHLIRKMTNKGIYFQNMQKALIQLGKAHALFKDVTRNVTQSIDLSKLSNTQLERLANGEDVVSVLIDDSTA